MLTEKEDEDDGGGAATTNSTVSLRGDAFLKEAVTKRPQAQGIVDGKDSSADEDILPKVSNKKQTKSGREWTAADLVKVAVKWPHYHTIFGPRKDKAAYDDLTVTEFIHGFITIPLDSHANSRVKNTQLRHFQHLKLYATHYGWEAARHAHGIIPLEMEAGRITWADEDSIQDLRIICC